MTIFNQKLLSIICWEIINLSNLVDNGPHQKHILTHSKYYNLIIIFNIEILKLPDYNMIIILVDDLIENKLILNTSTRLIK